MEGFQVVATTDEIPVGEGRSFELSGRAVAVFHHPEGWYAIDDLCPHMGASLATGHLQGSAVSCPWHGWSFDIRSGAWCDNPRIRTDTFPVRIVDGQVLVCVPAPNGRDTAVLTPDSSQDPAAGTAAKTAASSGTSPGPGTGSTCTGVTCAKGSSLTSTEVPASVPASSTPSGADRAGPLLSDFQALIRKMYFEKDQARGVSGTFMWLMEEVGELATALRGNDRENLAEEFADVLAWLATIANVAEVDLAAAVSRKYGSGCPGCRMLVCTCPDAEKP